MRKSGRKRFHPGALIGTLRFQVVFLMLLCYFLPTLLLGVFTHNVLLNRMQQQTSAFLTAGAGYAWDRTTQNIDRAIRLARDAIYDGTLLDTWSRWKAGNLSDADYLRLSRNYLDQKYSRDDLFTFAAYFPVERDNLLLYTRSGQEPAEYFRTGVQREVMEIGETLDTRSLFLQREGQLYLVRNLMNLRMERYGMLVLGISQDTLYAPLRAFADSLPGAFHVRLDRSGEENLDWTSLSPGITDSMQEPMIRYVRFSSSDDYQFSLLLEVDHRQQYREFYRFRWLVLFIYLLLIPILVLIGRYVRRRIVRPITLLSAASRRIESGELGVTVPMHGGDELGDLGVAFSNMSLRIQELIDRTYREELELKNAQIQALQSRVNPHFINNALENINWAARIEGSENISAMVASLSVLLNASMARNNRRMVTLREELDVAEAYIFFVVQRFGDSLTVERDVEPKALDGIVPLLTVQPVLENAVEHGIAPAGGGRIRLSFRRAGDCVQLSIMNSGKPIQPEDQVKIDAALSGENMNGQHLGLANIANRLRLIYNGRASIQVRSDKQGCTVVEMSIPQDSE